MRLLVSVTDADEARAAVAGGADVIDVKNPAEGSLGAPVPAVVARVRATIGSDRPLSVALGDLPHLPGTAALAALGAARAGADYVKVGLRGSSTEAEAVALLAAVRAAVPENVEVIAGTYADAARVPSRPLAPGALVAAARRAGVAGCLLDTAVKDGRRLLDWLDLPGLTALAADAHAAGLRLALAGALRAEDLPAIRATGADIAGVRSAACRDGRRSGPLDPERVAGLRAACAPVTEEPRGAAPAEGEPGAPVVRDMRPGEEAALVALQRRASLVWEEYREALLAHPDVFELPPDGRVRVVDGSDGPAGFSVVVDTGDGALELDGLFVEPHLMGAGLGRALVEDAVARAGDAVRLEVTANPRALGFYEKVGFRHGETVQTQFGPGVRMRRDPRSQEPLKNR